VIENLPDGTRVVRLADHVQIVPDEWMDGEPSTHYEYDEVVFEMPEDRTDTVEDVTEDFDDWWVFGQEEYEEPTLEERLAELEDIVFGIIVEE
jgi:hypothetical protein